MRLIQRVCQGELMKEKIRVALFTILISFCLLEFCIIIKNILTKEMFIPKIQEIYSLLTAILCSLIASGFMLFVPNASSSDSVKDIDINVKEILKKLEVLPAIYGDTDDPNSEFNTRLNNGILSSRKYIYFGDRALFMTKRLGRELFNHDHSRLEITVFLADIREDSIFKSREHMYLQKEKAKAQIDKTQRSINEIITNEKMEVLRSLYAIGKLSKQYEINVYLHKEIPFIRFELVDSLVVLTFLTQWVSGKDYPTTLMFENNDFFSANFEDYSEQIKKRSEKLPTDGLDMDYLRGLAESARLPDFADDEITKYYEEKVK